MEILDFRPGADGEGAPALTTSVSLDVRPRTAPFLSLAVLAVRAPTNGPTSALDLGNRLGSAQGLSDPSFRTLGL